MFAVMTKDFFSKHVPHLSNYRTLKVESIEKLSKRLHNCGEKTRQRRANSNARINLYAI